jgi:hypothetical protein
MKKCFTICFALLCLTAICCGQVGKEQTKPAADLPDLQALDHWAGKWESEMTINPNADLPKGGRSKGTSTGEWIHDGRFLLLTWKTDATEGMPKSTGSIIMTYDPGKKTYRSWSFFSSGYTRESRGVWDADAKTMTWNSRDDETGRTSMTKASFTDNTENWSTVDKDKEGTVLSESSGKNTRKAP